jgi:hypothetical protein
VRAQGAARADIGSLKRFRLYIHTPSYTVLLVRAGRGTRAGGYSTLMYMLQQVLLWLLIWQIDYSTTDSLLSTCGLLYIDL